MRKEIKNVLRPEKSLTDTSNIDKTPGKRKTLTFQDSEIEETKNSPPTTPVDQIAYSHRAQGKRQAPLLRPSRSISQIKSTSAPVCGSLAACAKAAWVAWVASRSGILAGEWLLVARRSASTELQMP